jgi:pilus assembly protein Flp/PilA
MRYRITRGREFAIDHGASAVEYGLLVGAIAAVIMGVIFVLGDLVGSTFQQTQDCLVAFQSEPACDTAAVDEP